MSEAPPFPVKSSHPPFLLSEFKWKSASPKECSYLLESEKIKLVLREGATEQELSVIRADGTLAFGPRMIGIGLWSDCGGQHYRGDLNGDGKMDYVFSVASGGNGMASQISEVTFLLSKKDSTRGSAYDAFEASTFATYGFGKMDLIKVHKSSSRPIFIRADFSEEKSADGKFHSYFVYSLWDFKGSRVEEANRRIVGFPKFIQYKNNPNSTETNLLTKAQKSSLWKKLKRASPRVVD